MQADQVEPLTKADTGLPGSRRGMLLAALFATILPGSSTFATEKGVGPAADRDEWERLTAENRKIIERYADAWKTGDRTALIDSYHPDFSLHYFGRSPLAGDHAGKAKALRMLAEFTRRTNRKLVAIVDIMIGPQRCAILARESFERDGSKAEFDRLLVYTMKEGRLHECWVYDGDPAAVDQFLR